MRRRKRYGGASASLMITFLLGVVVGFFLHPALMVLLQRDDAAPTSREAEPLPPTAPVGELAPPEMALPALDVPPLEVDLEEIWPTRLLIVGLPGTSIDRETAAILNRYKPGGVWLRASNTVEQTQISSVIRQVNTLAAIPDAMPLIAAAQQGGTIGNILRLPDALTYGEIARLESLDAIREAGRATAERALALGVGVLLSPVLDIFDPEEREAEQRPFFLGDTPETVSQAGVAYAEGLLEGGVLAAARHYPGIGSAIFQSDDVPLIAETEVEMLAATMLPFAEAAAYDISGIVIGNAAMPALDVNVPGRPAMLSPVMVRGVLRSQWGYEGVLLADDILSVASWSGNSPAEDIVTALASGCDAVLISKVSEEDMKNIISAIKQAVIDGTLDIEELNASRQRLDLWRRKLARSMPEPLPEKPATPVGIEGESPDESATEGEPDEEPEGEVEGEVEGEPEPEPEPVVEEPVEETPPAEAVAPSRAQPEGTREVVHVIKQGDTLTGIGRAYGVTAQDIMRWNNLSDANIKFGDKLVVYTSQQEPTPVPTPEPVPEPEPVPVPEPEPMVEEPAEAAAPEPAMPDETEEPSEEEATASPLSEKSEEGPPPLVPAEDMPLAAEKSGSAVDKSTEPPTDAPVGITPSVQPPNTLAREYEVMETLPLSVIADSFGVTVDQLKAWNGLTGEDAPAGTTVYAYLPLAEDLGEETPTTEEVEAVSQPAPAAPATGAEYALHVVGPGDTLNRLATRYGTTVQNLIAINELSNPDVVVLGTELKVPRP